MKKELISVDNLDAYIGKDNKVYVPKGTIITAGAKDELRKRGVALIYGDRPAPEPAPAASCGTCKPAPAPAPAPAGSVPTPAERNLESLSAAIADLLKTRYEVSNPEQIRLLTIEALRTIKANI